MSPLKPEAAAALSFEFNEILDPEVRFGVGLADWSNFSLSV